MNKEEKIDLEQKIIRKSITGELDIKCALKLAEEICDSIESHKDFNILIDIRRTVSRLKILDAMTFVSKFANLSFDYKNRIAWVVSDTDEQVNSAYLVRACMESKGLHFKEFFDYETALGWFRE